MTRTAIVTGAARGIGAATAKRLAADGNAVAVLDLDEAAVRRRPSPRSTDAGGRALAVGANVADAAAVADAVARVEAELGAPTILVNNAGIIRDNLLFKMTEDDWDSVLSVHLRGAFLMSRAVQAHQVDAGWGRIVNLSSTSALGNRGQANYAAAKAGMQGLTKTLALELGRYGVTANAVAPGFIVTDMTAPDRRARWASASTTSSPHAAAEVPVGRAGLPRRHRGRRVVLLLRGGRLRLRPGALRRRRVRARDHRRRLPRALADAVGRTATSDWFRIDQERIAAFADATEDWQWIHLDAERAASGPFGTTIAHGYLTLSAAAATHRRAAVASPAPRWSSTTGSTACGSCSRAVGVARARGDRDRRGRADAAGLPGRACTRRSSSRARAPGRFAAPSRGRCPEPAAMPSERVSRPRSLRDALERQRPVRPPQQRRLLRGDGHRRQRVDDPRRRPRPAGRRRRSRCAWHRRASSARPRAFPSRSRSASGSSGSAPRA